MLSLLLAPALAAAQSLDPRAYSNLPVGLNFLLAGYAHSQGEVAIEGLPLQDGRTRVHALPVGYVRSLNVFGTSGNFALLLPLVDLTASGSLDGATESRREVSGLAIQRCGWRSISTARQRFGRRNSPPGART
jgi:hypothetical protein